MKRVVLFAFALVAGLGGALAQPQIAKMLKPAGSYTYYLDGACDVAITCDDSFEGPSCASVYSGEVIYNQPGCQLQHQVNIPLGKLPL